MDGISFDFLRFWKEIYMEGSRVPLQEIGTIMDDSLRRDFTINSLYYNIHTKKIEDPLKIGMWDLNNK